MTTVIGFGGDFVAPEWDKEWTVHNWRNHVPQAVREIWDTFALHQKKSLAEWAQDLAERENWE